MHFFDSFIVIVPVFRETNFGGGRESSSQPLASILKIRKKEKKSSIDFFLTFDWNRRRNCLQTISLYSGLVKRSSGVI